MIKNISKISFYLKLSVSKFFVLQKKYHIGSKNWLIYRKLNLVDSKLNWQETEYQNMTIDRR